MFIFVQLYPQMKELAIEPLNIAKQYYEHQIYIQQMHQHHHEEEPQKNYP